VTSASETSNPIGVFDSGVGGLSVLIEIRRELPGEDLLYVADSGHAPYGDKPADDIQERAHAIVAFLVGRRAKAIVVACNTATGVSVDALRERWSIPIVGIEPAIKPAVATTKSGVVGVLATSQTIASTRFARLVETFGSGVNVIAQPCPGLVERVEEGDFSGPATRQLIEGYVRPLIEKGADTIVLGCTHYPFVTPAIAASAGAGIAIIDPAAAVARELRRRLERMDSLRRSTEAGTTRFWSSGPLAPLEAALHRFGVTGSAGIEPLPV
jgi:glutamate racemase